MTTKLRISVEHESIPVIVTVQEVVDGNWRNNHHYRLDKPGDSCDVIVHQNRRAVIEETPLGAA